MNPRYERYLQSKWWRHKRRHMIQKAGGKCSFCGSREQLQVHHKTYIRLGREKDSDLEVLCKTCHEQEHGHFVIEWLKIQG